MLRTMRRRFHTGGLGCHLCMISSVAKTLSIPALYAVLASMAGCLLPSDSDVVQLKILVPADTVRLAIGQEVAPDIQVSANGATLGTARLGYKSSDPAIVDIDSAGKLRGIRRGAVTVRAVLVTSASGAASPDTTFPVRVVLGGMRLAHTADSLFAIGDTVLFRPSYLDAQGDALSAADSAEIRPQFTLLSAGQAVTLDTATGTAVAKANGRDLVKVSVDTSWVTDTVTVRQKVARHVVSPKTYRFRSLGETVRLADSAWDRRGILISAPGATWVSSNTAVATVGETGLATSVGNGDAVIRATADGVADSTIVTAVQVPKRLRTVSGDGQRGLASSDLTRPFVVQVVDSLGSDASVPGLSIVFRVADGAAKIAGKDTAIVATTAAGRASVTLTLGPTPGVTNRVIVSAGGLADSLVFSALGTAPAYALVMMSGNGQVARVGSHLPSPFVVAVRDSLGNLVSNQDVRFDVLAGGGTIGGQVSVVLPTNDSGLVGATLTLGPGVGDTNRVTASSAGLVGSPLTFVAVGQGPVTTVRISPDSLQMGVQTTTKLSASLWDAAGSVLLDRIVSWASSEGVVASVDGQGIVTALSPGRANIVATSEGVSDTGVVTVVAGGTSVSGTISTNTTWTVAGAPYRIVGNTVVESGATLSIMPGVRIQADGSYFLRVQGELVARGGEGTPIVFTSGRSSPSPGDWVGIHFLDAVPASYDADGRYVTGSILEYVTVQYAADGVFAERCAPYVNWSTFHLNNVGLLRDETCGTGDRFIISNSVISDNVGCGLTFWHLGGELIDDIVADNGCGILSRWGTLLLNRINIVANKAGALAVDGGYDADLHLRQIAVLGNAAGICAPGVLSSGRVKENDFYANGTYDFSTLGCGELFAASGNTDISGNWWGTIDTAVVSTRVRDLNADPDLRAARALYAPVATLPIPNAGAQGLGYVSVSPSSTLLTSGQTAELTASVFGADGRLAAGETVRWVAGDTTVAKVNDAGLVTAMAPGVTSIAAVSKGRLGTVAITVTRP